MKVNKLKQLIREEIENSSSNSESNVELLKQIYSKIDNLRLQVIYTEPNPKKNNFEEVESFLTEIIENTLDNLLSEMDLEIEKLEN